MCCIDLTGPFLSRSQVGSRNTPHPKFLSRCFFLLFFLLLCVIVRDIQVMRLYIPGSRANASLQCHRRMHRATRNHCRNVSVVPTCTSTIADRRRTYGDRTIQSAIGRGPLQVIAVMLIQTPEIIRQNKQFQMRRFSFPAVACLKGLHRAAPKKKKSEKPKLLSGGGLSDHLETA